MKDKSLLTVAIKQNILTKLGELTQSDIKHRSSKILKLIILADK